MVNTPCSPRRGPASLKGSRPRLCRILALCLLCAPLSVPWVFAQAPAVSDYTMIVGRQAFFHASDLQKEDTEVRTAWGFLIGRGYEATWEGALRLKVVASGRTLDLVVVPFVPRDDAQSGARFVGLFRAASAPQAAQADDPAGVWIAVVDLTEQPKVVEDFYVWRTEVVPVQASVRSFLAAVGSCVAAAGVCRLLGPAWLGCTLVSCIPAAVGAAIEHLASTPPGLKCHVTSENVNLRDGPGTGYNTKVRLTRGQELTCLDSGPWVRVRLESGLEGYVAAQYIALSPRRQ